MRIAYGILCHTDALHIARLCKKLTVGTENHVFVHVDLKSDFAPFYELLHGMPQVTLLEERVAVYWGGYSAINATILLLREALRSGIYQRFQLLQGLEYPILSNKEIDDFFEKDPKREYLIARNISHIDSKGERLKYRFYWHLDRPQRPLAWLQNKFNTVLMLLGIIIPMRKNYVMDADGRKLDIFQGYAQFGLTMEAVQYIVDFHDRNEVFNRYFHWVYAPDESYFHTILYNSTFRPLTTYDGEADPDKVGDLRNLSYFEYPDKIVLFTRKSEWERIRNSGKLYFRKASSASGELLDYIDQLHMAE